MDSSLLEPFSEHVASEGSPRWLSVPASLETMTAAGVPARWMASLTGAMTFEERIGRLWGDLRLSLPRSYAVYSRNLYGLALLETQGRGWSLVYGFRMRQRLTLRRGFSPTPSLPPVAARFPADLSPLYSLHDGLVHFMTDDAGPLPASEWERVTSEGDAEPSLVKVALHGSEAFGFDISVDPVQAYRLSPDDDDVQPIDNVWAYLDDLIEGPLTHAAYA
jgi:hypothetical protein